VTGYATRLDTFATNLAAAVNSKHALGQTDAASPVASSSGPPSGIRFCGQLPHADQQHERPRVGRSRHHAPGAKDGVNADRLADLAKDPDGPDREYQRLVVDLGAHSQAAQRRAEIQTATLTEVDAERTSQSGVNLDEEMSNLVQYERSYQAAAKVISTIDDMLDVLINRM
jgi:flagellar hook-associated protein 1 FlgK